jgi:hypothetical protein
MSAKSVLFTLLFIVATFSSSICQTTLSKQEQINQHAQLAQQYLKQQRPDLAITELQTLVALEPENPDAQGNLGVLLFFANGDFFTRSRPFRGPRCNDNAATVTNSLSFADTQHLLLLCVSIKGKKYGAN